MNPSKLILISAITLSSACSQFFPDKEKDYVYSREIPPLQIPPELEAEHLALQQEALVIPDTLSKTLEFIDQGENQTFLRINSPFAHIWRVVGKALTERAIEITDKNRSLAIYYVQYDPELQAVSDGSFWDEVVFFFGSDANQEIEYNVFLVESDLGTEIYVRDQLGNKLSEGDGIKLLNLLYDTILEDFNS